VAPLLSAQCLQFIGWPANCLECWITEINVGLLAVGDCVTLIDRVTGMNWLQSTEGDAEGGGGGCDPTDGSSGNSNDGSHSANQPAAVSSLLHRLTQYSALYTAVLTKHHLTRSTDNKSTTPSRTT